MKIRRYLIASALILMLVSKAQWPTPLNLNTATNAGNTGTVAVGSLDNNWMSSTVSINSGYSKATAVSPVTPGAWFIPPSSSTAGWVSYVHNCAGNVTQSESWCLGGDIEEYYKVTITLPASSGTYALNYNAYADNCIYKMYLNNTTTPFYTAPFSSNYYWEYGFATPISGTVTNGWAAGTNTLYIHVKSSAYLGIQGNTGLFFSAMGTYKPGTTISLPEVPGGNSATLLQNFPNPFDESCVISYVIPTEFSKGQIQVTSIEGKVVKTIDISAKAEGNINILREDLNPGMYFYSLVTDGKTICAKKMLLN